MVERSLALVLLLSWQSAMVSMPETNQALFGIVSSLVMGLTLIVLLAGTIDHEPSPADTDEEVVLHARLASLVSIH